MELYVFNIRASKYLIYFITYFSKATTFKEFKQYTCVPVHANIILLMEYLILSATAEH